MAERHFPSTCLNFLPSVGSCFMMSGESKIGCRYIQARWHLSHWSRHSDTYASLSFHSSISSLNGLLKGENCMACVTTICSSRSAMTSSAPFRMYVPVVRYGSLQSKKTFSHAATMALSCVSMPSSLPLLSPMSASLAAWSTMPSSTKFSSVKFSMSGDTSVPTSSATCCQWRSRMPWLRRPVIMGTLGTKSSICTLMSLQISRTSAESSLFSKDFTALNSVFAPDITLFSAYLASMLPKGPPIHFWMSFSQWYAVTHSCENGSHSFTSCCTME
mmetsp:Transcript_92125/g.237753  ORF Transcript_92125/g.237753 Transcript_92125/m.237753 type:complete len:274 (-) Transcript_92125:1123-1944(-)